MSESVFLTKDALLTEEVVLAQEKVELSGNRHVFVREMTASEKDTWEGSLRKEVPILGAKPGKPQTEFKMDLQGFRAKLAICTVCNQKGERQFKMDRATIKLLGEKLNATDMEKIADVASKLNHITPEDQEELLKNSEASQENGSNSGSAES